MLKSSVQTRAGRVVWSTSRWRANVPRHLSVGHDGVLAHVSDGLVGAVGDVGVADVIAIGDHPVTCMSSPRATG
jgi:hypothetical protein